MGCAHQKPKAVTLEQIKADLHKVIRAAGPDEGTFGDPSHLNPTALKPFKPARPRGRQAGQLVSYTVAQGDTLWGIAAEKTSSPFNWPGIWKANRDQIADPDKIYISTPLKWDPAKVENPVYKRIAYHRRPYYNPKLKK